MTKPLTDLEMEIKELKWKSENNLEKDIEYAEDDFADKVEDLETELNDLIEKLRMKYESELISDIRELEAS